MKLFNIGYICQKNIDQEKYFFYLDFKSLCFSSQVFFRHYLLNFRKKQFLSFLTNCNLKF